MLLTTVYIILTLWAGCNTLQAHSSFRCKAPSNRCKGGRHLNNNIIADYYEPLLTDNHFIPVDSNNHFNSAGQCWQLSPEFGENIFLRHCAFLHILGDLNIHRLLLNETHHLQQYIFVYVVPT